MSDCSGGKNSTLLAVTFIQVSALKIRMCLELSFSLLLDHLSSLCTGGWHGGDPEECRRPEQGPAVPVPGSSPGGLSRSRCLGQSGCREDSSGEACQGLGDAGRGVEDVSGGSSERERGGQREGGEVEREGAGTGVFTSGGSATAGGEDDAGPFVVHFSCWLWVRVGRDGVKMVGGGVRGMMSARGVQCSRYPVIWGILRIKMYCIQFV